MEITKKMLEFAKPSDQWEFRRTGSKVAEVEIRNEEIKFIWKPIRGQWLSPFELKAGLVPEGDYVYIQFAPVEEMDRSLDAIKLLTGIRTGHIVSHRCSVRIEKGEFIEFFGPQLSWDLKNWLVPQLAP